MLMTWSWEFRKNNSWKASRGENRHIDNTINTKYKMVSGAKGDTYYMQRSRRKWKENPEGEIEKNKNKRNRMDRNSDEEEITPNKMDIKRINNWIMMIRMDAKVHGEYKYWTHTHQIWAATQARGKNTKIIETLGMINAKDRLILWTDANGQAAKTTKGGRGKPMRRQVGNGEITEMKWDISGRAMW